MPLIDATLPLSCGSAFVILHCICRAVLPLLRCLCCYVAFPSSYHVAAVSLHCYRHCALHLLGCFATFRWLWPCHTMCCSPHAKLPLPQRFALILLPCHYCLSLSCHSHDALLYHNAFRLWGWGGFCHTAWMCQVWCYHI